MIGALIDGAIRRRKVVLGVTVIAAIFGLVNLFNGFGAHDILVFPITLRLFLPQ